MIRRLGRRRGEEVKHLVVRHAETPVHEQRLLRGRLTDGRGGIEDPGQLLELGPHAEDERGDSGNARTSFSTRENTPHRRANTGRRSAFGPKAATSGSS